jgi:hypothetical protein
MNCHSGPAPELTVAQVLQVFLPEYLDRHPLPPHHLKVLRRLAQCRSGQLGWTVWQCQQCHRTHWRPHGCGDRHCPCCQHQRSRQWLQEQRRALLPVRYFHWVFKPLQDAGTFAALLRQVRARRWVVFAKGSVVGPDAVLDYLGRYTHRVAITNGRLRTLDSSTRTLTFTYKDYADANRLKTLTLTGVEFIRRLRLHLLPRGFTKIRHYGLLGNNRRHWRVPQAQTALATSPLRLAPAPTPRPTSPPLTCPHCQSTELRCIGRVERSGKIRLFARPWLSGPAPAYTDTS